MASASEKKRVNLFFVMYLSTMIHIYDQIWPTEIQKDYDLLRREYMIENNI